MIDIREWLRRRRTARWLAAGMLALTLTGATTACETTVEDGEEEEVDVDEDVDEDDDEAEVDTDVEVEEDEDEEDEDL